MTRDEDIGDYGRMCVEEYKQNVRNAVMRLPDDNRRHILLKELEL